MRHATRVNPIDWLRASAAKMPNRLCEQHEPRIITQNDEGTAVGQDIKSFEETRRTSALPSASHRAIRMSTPAGPTLRRRFRRPPRVSTSQTIALSIDGKPDET